MLPESCKATTVITIITVVFMAALSGSFLDSDKASCGRDL
jgi:hypothetical protein